MKERSCRLSIICCSFSFKIGVRQTEFLVDGQATGLDGGTFHIFQFTFILQKLYSGINIPLTSITSPIPSLGMAIFCYEGSLLQMVLPLSVLACYVTQAAVIKRFSNEAILSVI